MTTSAQREAAALCMEHLVDHDWHGYDQSARYGDGEGFCEVATPIGTCYVAQGDRDCSSAVISAYEAAGISCGGATYTGNMLSCMCGTGNFRAHRMSDGYNCDDGYIAQRGDTYLDEVNHTAMCISAEPDMLAEFSGNEYGGIVGGQVGDQTGSESHRAPFYAYPWQWCLECVVDGGGAPMPAPTPTPTPAHIDDIRYRVSTDPNGAEWLPEMIGRHDTGGSADNFGGELGVAMRWLAVEGAGRYRVCTDESGWLPYVERYDVSDLDTGCAGDGSPIIAVEIPNGGVRFAVHDLGGGWSADMVGVRDTGGSADVFGGSMVQADAIRIERA